MRIIDAIRRVDELKPNSYTQEQKTEWLRNVDGLIIEECIKTHEGEAPKVDYDNITSTLMVPHPYDELYVNYLFMMIDYSNGELKKYNNSAEVYNESLLAFKKWYNRTHKPITSARLKF